MAGTTTIADDWKDKNGYTTYHLGSRALQALIASGIPASLITTMLGSLIFRIAAAKRPVLFISHPLVGPAIRICLLVERTGIMQFSWMLSKLFISVLRFQHDSVYESAQISPASNIGETNLSSELPSADNDHFSQRTRRGLSSGSVSSVEITDAASSMVGKRPDSIFESIFTEETDNANAVSIDISATQITELASQESPLRQTGLRSPANVSPASRERVSSVETREIGNSMQQIYAAVMLASPDGMFTPTIEDESSV